MEKKFKEYYSIGLKNSFKSLYKRKTNLFKYYVCILIYIITIPLFLLRPVINMGTFRLANQINDDNDIDLSSITKSSDNPKSYFTALFAGLIKMLIIFGIVLVLLVIAGILGLIGYAIMSFTGKEEYLFVLLFASPALLAILVYLFFVPLIYAETGYIVNANNDINASNVVNLSFNAYKNHGKRARFGILVINSLIKICYLVLAGIGAALPIFVKGYTTNALGLTIIFGIIALIPYIIFAPLFTLGTISSLSLLNDDIVKDTLTDVVSATNVKFTIPKKDVDDLTTEEKLVYIFDNTEDLKPSIKSLKILDSLEVADEKNIETAGDNITKVEEEKPTSIKEEIVNNEVVEDVEEAKEEILEDNKEQSFEAFKEASDENITDSIVEEVNSEKISEEVSEEVVDKLENEQETSESKDFEAIKEVSEDAKDDTIEENKTDDDTVSITEVLENDSEPTEETKEEEITQDEVPVAEEKEEPIVDETPSIEPIEENNDEVISEEEPKEIQEDVKEIVEEKVEEMPQESDNLEKIDSDNKEEDFDFDLFEEKENKDDELLNEMDDFLKKGDD